MAQADLVLEGGGVKGIGLVGAVVTLASAGWTFPRVAGTSAGAICAALVAGLQKAGRPMADLRTIMNTIDYGAFMHGSWAEEHLGKVGQLGHLALHQGMYDGDYLVSWLGGALHDLGVDTFADLAMDDPDSSLPPGCRFSLVVHTSDITRGRLVRLPWDYPSYGVDAGAARVVDAVRASMSIPFFFTPVHVDAPEFTDASDSFAAGEVTWVDGGLLSNFPIEVFDRTDGQPSRWPTIGVKLSAAQPTPVTKKNPGSPLSEAVDCLRTALDNADRFYVPPATAKRTIFVDSMGLAATDFHLTTQQQQALYDNGAAGAQRYLEAASSPA